MGKPKVKHVLRAGDLSRLERLLDRAAKLSAEQRSCAQEIAREVKRCAGAIMNYRQTELGIDTTPPKRRSKAEE
jgi:hypothetical protein